MNKNNKITTCIVIHNEEKVLARCLESVQKISPNILVVHDGKCEDNSLKICQKYGAKVFQRKFEGEAEPHRAWLFNKVTTPWILSLDADEFLSPELAKKIPQLINNETVSCYEFLWLYWDGKKYRTKNWPWRKTLFRTDSFHYLAVPHEEVRIISGEVKRIPLHLEHKPTYNNVSFEKLFTKWMKWVKVHAKYLLKNPDSIDRYPKQLKQIRPHYSFLSNNPLFYAFPISVYHFIGLYFVAKGFKEGWYGFKASMLMALYYFILCIEIYKLKVQQK